MVISEYSKLPLYDYQLEAIQQTYRHFQIEYYPGAAIATEPGLGKSVITIGTIAKVYQADPNMRLVVIATAKQNTRHWIDQFNRFMPEGISYNIIQWKYTGEYMQPTLNAIDREQLTILFISHAVYAKYSSWIRIIRPSMIVCDDAVKLKTHSTKTS